MLNEIPDEELSAALDACVDDVLWAADIDGPPIDADLVAERMGLVVAADDRLACRGRFVRLGELAAASGGQGLIVVGPAERPERRQWAVAHEIGEAIAHRVFERLKVRLEMVLPEVREWVANQLAQCLLLPRRWFAADGHALDWNLLELKERYATASHELIARRMLQMRPPVVITLCDQGHVKWRRATSANRPPRLLPEELDALQKTHVTGLPVDESLDSAATGLERVRVWPVHEPGWKREILRSDVAEI
ncbi:MAG: ImmA/IrrE family metallo-endopeptidase [Pirellulales bacterium]